MIGRAKILYARKLELEEQLERIINTAEAQIKLIKVLAPSLTETNLSPQLKDIEEAKKVLGKEDSSKEANK